MKIRCLVLLGALSAGAALAQDPPSRVARLNWLIGSVSFLPAGIDTWTAATLNYPLTTGDHLYTDAGSRAEMHVGANAIRLNGETNFGFLNLDDRTVQARFTEGAMEIRLRLLEEDDLYEIDTPEGAVSLLRTGDYRIDTDPARNATMVTVWSGEAEVSANGGSWIVHAGQTAWFSEGREPDIRGANPADDFDQFTVDRNLRDDRVLPPVHVSLAMPGYEDLDEYGAWSETPDDGWVWTPRVAADWVPYQQGRWAWVEPWGWTWIDEAPWGFAPFHFGRWAFLRASWVWVPGAVTRRPVYAPALVAFVSGPRSGAIGWFPLGPREPFYPAYRVSAAYLRQVNITHVTNINVIGNGSATNVRYTNQQVPGAVMAMPRQGFAGSRPVREQGQRVSPQQLAQAEVPVGSPGIAPLRESMMGGRTNQRIATPSQAAMTRPVVARSAPPPPRVSFQATQLLIEQNNGRPLAPDQLVQLRQAQPAATVNRAPVRTLPAGVPAPVNAPAPLRPAERLADRMITRPPGTRLEPRNPEAVRPTAPQTARPELTRPQPERQPERQADRQPARRPVPPAAPAAVRPQAEVRRESAPVVREPRAEPRQDVRPEPAKPEPKKEDKK